MKLASCTIRWVGIAALLALFAGCEAEETDPPVELERPEIDLAVDPISITAELDSPRAVTARVAPQEGGAVSATSADGTVFTLQIPPGAFLSVNEVTLTPVLSAEGLPLGGGLVAAVHLAPEGLRFLVPATLTLEFAEAGPDAGMQRVPFAFHGRGEEFHLHPAEVSANRASFAIRHFSGYGVGQGTAGDVDELRGKHSPTESEDQANHHHGDSGQDYCTMLRHWGFEIYTAVMNYRGEQAIVDYAFNQYVAWRGALSGCDFAQQAQLLAEIHSHLAAAMMLASSEAHGRCVRDNDPVQAVNLLRLAAWAELYPDIGAAAGVLRVNAEECARFELKLRSAITSNDGEMNISAEVTAEVELRSMALMGTVLLMGNGSSRYTSLDYQSPECSVSESSQPGELVVMDLELNLDGVLDRSQLARQLVLMLVPAGPREDVTMVCNGQTAHSVSSIWPAVFSLFHLDEASGTLRVRGFESGAGAVLAVATFDRSRAADGTQFTEDSTIEILHTPER